MTYQDLVKRQRDLHFLLHKKQTEIEQQQTMGSFTCQPTSVPNKAFTFPQQTMGPLTVNTQMQCSPSTKSPISKDCFVKATTFVKTSPTAARGPCSIPSFQASPHLSSAIQSSTTSYDHSPLASPAVLFGTRTQEGRQLSSGYSSANQSSPSSYNQSPLASPAAPLGTTQVKRQLSSGYSSATQSTAVSFNQSPLASPAAPLGTTQERRQLSSGYSSANQSSPASHVVPLSTENKKDCLASPAMSEGTDCRCNRSPQVILCKACGATREGRVRQTCNAHPNKIFLMDLSFCPQCQSQNLKEISDKL